jgi:hypothetical protein
MPRREPGKGRIPYRQRSERRNRSHMFQTLRAILQMCGPPYKQLRPDRLPPRLDGPGFAPRRRVRRGEMRIIGRIWTRPDQEPEITAEAERIGSTELMIDRENPVCSRDSPESLEMVPTPAVVSERTGANGGGHGDLGGAQGRARCS